MRRQPVYVFAVLLTVAVVVALAGVSKATLDLLLLHPLVGVHNGRGLVWMSEHDQTGQGLGTSLALADDWATESRTLAGVSTYLSGEATMVVGENAERMRVTRVAASLFPLLGATPLFGRIFSPGDDRPTAAPVAVLSYAVWRSRFGADAAVIGRMLRLDDKEYRVVGVMPQRFAFPIAEPDGIWTPIAPAFAPIAQARGIHLFRVVARLEPGVTLAAATSELQQIRLRTASEAERTSGDLVSTDVEYLSDYVTRAIRRPAIAFGWMIAAVLVIACANLAGLLLVRAMQRNDELRVRIILGAPRIRAMGQLVSEAAALSLLGVVIGDELAFLATRLIAVLPPNVLPQAHRIELNWSTLIPSDLVVMLITSALAVLPAAWVTRNTALNGTANPRWHSAGRLERRLRAVLVQVEVAVAILLSFSAAALARSVQRLLHIDTGYTSEHVVTARLTRPVLFITERELTNLRQFADNVADQIAAIPGLEAAALATIPRTSQDFLHEIWSLPRSETPVIRVGFVQASPSYFTTLHIPLLKGQGFTSADLPGSRRVAIVSATAARQLYPGENPVGHEIQSRELIRPVEIIGVCGDVLGVDLTAKPSPLVYFPLDQWPGASLTVFIRSQAVRPALLLQELKAAIRAVDPNQPITDAYALPDLLLQSVAVPRFALALLLSFAGSAIVLVTVGIYGVVSYSVRARRRELSIRIALGAGRGGIGYLVLLQAGILVASGLAAGAVLALFVSPFLGRVLYDPPTFDFTALSLALVLVVVVSCIALVEPLRLALSSDPVVAMRVE
jgi:predicted permease